MSAPFEVPAREPDSGIERPPRKDPGRSRRPIEEPPPGASDDPDVPDDPAPIDEPGNPETGLDRDPGIDERDTPTVHRGSREIPAP
jgi:hypothetical protein